MNRFVRALFLAAIAGFAPSIARGQDLAKVDSSTTAAVGSHTGGFTQALPQPYPSYGYPAYGSTQPTTTGMNPNAGPTNQAPNTTLTFPPDTNTKPNWNSSGPTGSSSSSSTPSTPSTPTRTGNDDAGLPAPAPAPTVAPQKKSYLEGHVVLFLRAPGDEDPSPKGVIARFSREAKIVKRLAPEVAKGNRPATKPEDAVLRDPAPQGFYLPDEVDAWLVTQDGTLYVLASENANFDKIAALGLSSQLNVAGPASDLALDSAAGTVQKVKVLGITTDGSEPKADAPAPAKKHTYND
jgi:hypothetical protein